MRPRSYKIWYYNFIPGIGHSVSVTFVDRRGNRRFPDCARCDARRVISSFCPTHVDVRIGRGARIRTGDPLLRSPGRVGQLIDFAARLATEKTVRTRSGHSSGTELVLVFRPLAQSTEYMRLPGSQSDRLSEEEVFRRTVYAGASAPSFLQRWRDSRSQPLAPEATEERLTH